MKQQYNKLQFIKDKQINETTKQQYIWKRFLELPLGKIMLLKEHSWEKFLESPLLLSTFDNCFFPLFSVFKNNFLFLKLKNLFGNPKWLENKNYSQNLICEGN